MKTKTFNTIEQALQDLRDGKLVIVVDDEDRENEGDFIGAAEKCTPEMINFMATHGRGLICTALDKKRAEQFDLKLMVCGEENDAQYNTPFTVSIDYKHAGTTTGISAYDRATTVQALLNPEVSADDFARPGHIFPLLAKDGGVFSRNGHTEATVDLMDLAGMENMGVLCEIMNPDGTMARVPDLFEISEQFDLKMITIKDLVNYKLRHGSRVQRTAAVEMPTQWGDFELVAFRDRYSEKEHLALVKGTFSAEDEVLVRFHSECLMGDVFGSSRCSCGGQLNAAMEIISNQEAGIILYLRNGDPDIGLFSKLLPTVEGGLNKPVDAKHALSKNSSDLTEYAAAVNMLYALGAEKIRVLSDDESESERLKEYGLEIVESVTFDSGDKNRVNYSYMSNQQKNGGHVIKLKNYN